MQKLEKNSLGGEARSRRTSERGRWGLAKCCPICPGEAPQLREPETLGNLCDVPCVGIGLTQCAADLSQPTQQHISGWAHAEELGTARPKGSVAHPDEPADFW